MALEVEARQAADVADAVHLGREIPRKRGDGLCTEAAVLSGLEAGAGGGTLPQRDSNSANCE